MAIHQRPIFTYRLKSLLLRSFVAIDFPTSTRVGVTVNGVSAKNNGSSKGVVQFLVFISQG